MNQVMDVILKRKSVRAYEDRPIPDAAKKDILRTAIRAPTAGNMMLYSIIEVRDPAAKATLARTCDDQPFIARAPLVLLFLADCQRWYDYFIHSGVEQLCAARGEAVRRPDVGDLMLACCDALIAAQTAVIAAESLGLGSCYIGDIMENYEAHRDLFTLPRYVFPICLLCFGYPTQQQKDRPQTTRFEQEFVVFEDRYRRLSAEDFAVMYGSDEMQAEESRSMPVGVHNLGQRMYERKFNAGFSREMSRSVRAMIQAWCGEQ